MQGKGWRLAAPFSPRGGRPAESGLGERDTQRAAGDYIAPDRLEPAFPTDPSRTIGG